MQLQTLNLFELSQHFSQTGPHWLKESGRRESPHLTPAPPPSACGYYRTHSAQRRETEKREDEDSDLNYGGLDYKAQGMYRKHGDRVTFHLNRTY